MPKMTRRSFLRSFGLGLLAVGVPGGLYGGFVEPNQIEIVEQRIALPGLPPGMQGLRIVQFSDMHMGAWTPLAQLKRAVEQTLAQKPDLVLITGDFLSARWDHRRAIRELDEGLSPLSGQVPVMFVLGNHDHKEGEQELHALLARLGFLELDNRIETFRRGGDVLHFAGIDSVSTGHQYLGRVARDAPEDAPVILLAHEPDMAEFSAETGRFAMQISGHSHGGQVVLPLVGRLILPWMGRKYPAGLYQVGKMLQYTNRGLGMIHLPMRINCLPELTVFTFVAG